MVNGQPRAFNKVGTIEDTIEHTFMKAYKRFSTQDLLHNGGKKGKEMTRTLLLLKKT
jgi:hypothetical protein